MQRRMIVSADKPQTQCIDAIKALLSWRGRASDPLPSFVEMGEGEGRLVLVLSNKKDAYYTTTARECSCPARSWHPNGPCKHMRRYFSEQQTAKPAAIRQPNAGRWHGHNGPVLDEVERGAKAAPSIPLVDTLGEPSAGELAYWSIQEDRIMLSTFGEA